MASLLDWIKKKNAKKSTSLTSELGIKPPKIPKKGKVTKTIKPKKSSSKKAVKKSTKKRAVKKASTKLKKPIFNGGKTTDISSLLETAEAQHEIDQEYKAQKKALQQERERALAGKKPSEHGFKPKKSKSKTALPVKRDKFVTTKASGQKFIPVGVPGLEKLLPEGFPQGAAVLIEGGPGAGKTIFCLQTAYEACKKGMKALFMTFEESEEKLRDHMKSFGFDVDKYEKKGLLKVKRFNSLDVARSVEALLSEAKKELLIDIQPVLIPEDFKPDVVCIDSLSSIASAFAGEDARFRVYMEQLFRYLEHNKINSFLIRETSHPTHIGSNYTEQQEAVSFLSDGIIVLYDVIYFSGRRGRALEVLKMRGTNIDRRIVQVEVVDKKGFVINTEKEVKMQQMQGSYKLT